MIVLGIETSTQICSIALVNEQGLLGEMRINIKNIHASKLFVMIKQLVENTGRSLEDIDGMAVSIGPGSFTGLRIGLAAAKGMAMGGDMPITPVSTLQALVSQVPQANATIAAIIRSRKDEYYVAIYNREQYIDTCVTDVHLIHKDELYKLVPADAIMVGHTTDIQHEKWQIISPDQICPNAYSIAKLGLEQLKTNVIQSMDTLEPLYHQDFIAGKPKNKVIDVSGQ